MTDESPCREETETYRKCMKDARQSRSFGRCDGLKKTMEKCRDAWRQKHDIVLRFDHTRVLPPPQCSDMNGAVQECLQRNNADNAKCRAPIESLDRCMKAHPCPTKPK